MQYIFGDINFKKDDINLQNVRQSLKYQLKSLSKIAEIQPQTAYCAYMFDFKHKFMFFL